MKEVFTSIVRIKGDKNHRVVSVKSNKEVERKLFVEFSKVCNQQTKIALIVPNIEDETLKKRFLHLFTFFYSKQSA